MTLNPSFPSPVLALHKHTPTSRSILHYFAFFLYTRSLNYNRALEMSRKGAMERIMMHSTPIRTMCLVVGMIMLMVSTGYGTDADGKYTAYGHGTDSCNKYLNVMSGVTEK